MVQFSISHAERASALGFDQQVRLLMCWKEMITVVKGV
jgi:hypothetical protein